MAVERDENSLTEENIAQQGLQSAVSVLRFLNSKLGLKILDEIIAFVENKIKEQNINQQIAAEETMRMSSLLSEKEKIESESELQKMASIAQQPLPPLPKIPVKEAEPSSGVTLASLEKDLGDVEKEITKKNELYKNYEDNIKEAEDFTKTIDLSKSDQKEHNLDLVKQQINKLQGTPEQREKEANEIYKLLDEGKEAQARARLDALNAKNVQVGILNDMVSVLEGKKEIYTKDGNKATTFEDADYIVPADKRLVKDGDQLYLLSEGQSLPEDKVAARKAFVDSEHEMSSVKNLIKHNKGIEMSVLDKEVARISGQINDIKKAATPTPASPPKMSGLSQMPNTDPKSSLHNALPDHDHSPTSGTGGEQPEHDLTDIERPQV